LRRASASISDTNVELGFSDSSRLHLRRNGGNARALSENTLELLELRQTAGYVGLWHLTSFAAVHKIR
jgi:hypothetical protein